MTTLPRCASCGYAIDPSSASLQFERCRRCPDVWSDEEKALLRAGKREPRRRFHKETTMAKKKRMFVMVEIETAMKATEAKQCFENADVALGIRILQAHVNVAKAEKPKAAAD